jgi:hypothetical protein
VIVRSKGGVPAVALGAITIQMMEGLQYLHREMHQVRAEARDGRAARGGGRACTAHVHVARVWHGASLAHGLARHVGGAPLTCTCRVGPPRPQRQVHRGLTLILILTLTHDGRSTEI